MRRLQSSKLWLALRPDKPPAHARKAMQKNETRSQKETIWGTQIPIEILQQVFSHLDMLALLLQCRRVCRLWNQCIPGRSPTLRSTLFLAQAQARPGGNSIATLQTPSIHFGVKLDGSFTTSPRDAQRATGYTIYLRRDEFSGLERDGVTVTVTINPILLLDTTRTKLRRYCNASATRGVDTIPPLWLTMHASHPPAQKLVLYFLFEDTDVPTEECRVTPHSTEKTLENPTGITLAQVYGAMHDAMWWPRLSLSRCRVHVQVLPSVNGGVYGVEGAGSDGEGDDSL